MLAETTFDMDMGDTNEKKKMKINKNENENERKRRTVHVHVYECVLCTLHRVYITQMAVLKDLFRSSGVHFQLTAHFTFPLNLVRGYIMLTVTVKLTLMCLLILCPNVIFSIAIVSVHVCVYVQSISIRFRLPGQLYTMCACMRGYEKRPNLVQRIYALYTLRYSLKHRIRRAKKKKDWRTVIEIGMDENAYKENKNF